MFRAWVAAVRGALVLAICAAGSFASQTQVPAAFASRLEAVRAVLGAGNYAAAEQTLRGLVAESPSSADAHFLLGFALQHEGKATESLAQYTAGAKFAKPGPDDFASVASDYVLLKDFADADRWFRAALQGAPTSAQLWYLLGRTQYNENRWADAEHSFLACLGREPHHVRAEYNLGLVYEAEQRIAEAQDAYKTAIGWEGDPPDDIQPYLDWGMLLRRQGKIAEALPLLTVAAQGRGAANPLAHQELGLVLDSLGRTQDAVAEVKKAVAITPNVEALHFFLGRMYRKIGQGSDATREFAEAARIAGTQSDSAVPNETVQ